MMSDNSAESFEDTISRRVQKRAADSGLDVRVPPSSLILLSLEQSSEIHPNGTFL